ncbi:MAG: nucleotide sugar dehydrogenase, partial [Gammaproteobacteria bacterium]|nr:nucleotide sugar dehydrogenase [Gammaproteobacteria bacterium]NIW49894.1 nucleotide sugar dehydrogenase [Gammaproteobacteria bacterium]
NELKSFDVNVQVYDPMVDEAEVMTEYGLKVCNKADLIKAGAVILAVTHEEFLTGGWDYILDLLDEDGVVFDVKSVLPRDACPENI